MSDLQFFHNPDHVIGNHLDSPSALGLGAANAIQGSISAQAAQTVTPTPFDLYHPALQGSGNFGAPSFGDHFQDHALMTHPTDLFSF